MVFIILNAIVTIVIELFEMLFYLWVKMKPINLSKDIFTAAEK